MEWFIFTIALPMVGGFGVCLILYGLGRQAVQKIVAAFGVIGRTIVGPTGLFPTTGWRWQRSQETPPPEPEPDPTGLFLIDERCPGCLGTGRLRVDLLEDDLAEERQWRELELEVTSKKFDWQLALTCTGCGLPFLCHKDYQRDFCHKGDCQDEYYKRGNRTLGTEQLQ